MVILISPLDLEMDQAQRDTSGEEHQPQGDDAHGDQSNRHELFKENGIFRHV